MEKELTNDDISKIAYDIMYKAQNEESYTKTEIELVLLRLYRDGVLLGRQQEKSLK